MKKKTLLSAFFLIGLNLSAFGQQHVIYSLQRGQYSDDQMKAALTRFNQSYVVLSNAPVLLRDLRKNFEIKGEIVNVLSDQTILAIDGEFTMLHLTVLEDTSKATTGAKFKVWGMQTGKYEYETVAGSLSRIKAYHQMQPTWRPASLDELISFLNDGYDLPGVLPVTSKGEEDVFAAPVNRPGKKKSAPAPKIFPGYKLGPLEGNFATKK